MFGIRIPAPLKRTGTDVCTTVSAVTSTVTHGAEALAYLTESGSLRAQAYRDDTISEITENAGRRRYERINAAKRDVARRLLEVKRELDEDPELAAVFHSLDDDLFAAPATLRVAAE